MKKRVTSLVLSALACSMLGFTVFAATEPASGTVIYLDEAEVDTLIFQIKDNTTYVTVDSFVTMLDAEAMVEEENGIVAVAATTITEVVDVGDQEGEAGVAEEGLTLSACAGTNYIVANGRYLYVQDGVFLIDGKVAVPIRVLSKAFNLEVFYDGQANAIYLTHQTGPAYLASANSFYDGDALYWLSHIIYAESGNQPLRGKVAVGNVVMNRVNSSLFPNDVYSVIFQRNQFSPTINGSIYRTPNEESVIAAKLVLEGAVVLGNALFFNQAGLNTYAARTRPYVATIGGHTFYA